MKLSDSRFIGRSIARSNPTPAQSVEPSELGVLRGYGDRTHRDASVLLPNAEEKYEPVSFVDPQFGRRVYGWLVGVDANGDARVEIGDGEYACVPPKQIRRV